MIFSSVNRRRHKLRSTPIAPEWREILRRRCAFYGCLPPEDQRELEGHIQVFLAEKRFEGCDGLVITDEIRVVIAGLACLLLLHRDTNYFPDLKSILVYPGAYFSRMDEDEDDAEGFDGQSWQRGPVILAWDAVEEGVAGLSDGQNVVLHEFAHQLDEEDGEANGVPVLGPKLGPMERLNQYRSWAEVLSREFGRLQRASEAGDESVLDEYGASAPAEFFAVVTECFFENPRRLRQDLPDLYNELKRFYHQDPAAWNWPEAPGIESKGGHHV